MAEIGVRELRQNASEWIRRAEAGERINITRRGEVVAVLGPPPEGDVRDRLIKQGRLRPATGNAGWPVSFRATSSVSDALAELREDER